MRGERGEREREGFLLPHQSFGSCPTDADGRESDWLWQWQPQGADLAEIQSRSFYQPPEVDLTAQFLDRQSGWLYSQSAPHLPQLQPITQNCCALLSGLMQTQRGRRETGYKDETRSKALTMHVCEWLSIWICVCGFWGYILYSSGQKLTIANKRQTYSLF